MAKKPKTDKIEIIEPSDSRIKIIREGALGTRPSWEEYFMKMAIGASSRASCHNVHSGSIVTYNNRIRSTGYNGAAPQVEENCLSTGCRKANKGLEYEASLGSGECIGIHSEMNGLGNLPKEEVDDLCLYTTIMPCHTCGKNMLPYGVRRVVFKSFYSDSEIKSTLDLFQEANVEVCRLDLSPERCIDIDLNPIPAKYSVWTPEERGRINKILKSLKKDSGF